MNETIKKLKNSPLFNLSLSSRELFHSNFLYWVGSNYPNEFGKIFSIFLNEKPENLAIKEIFREKENIDLSFSYYNGQEVLIENKVKSMPYMRQLETYSKKHTNFKNYVLLSLSKPMFFKGQEKLDINGAIWHYLSYSDLETRLKSIHKKINNEYHRQIIIDYCNLIGGLVEINKLCDLKEEDFFDFHDEKKNKLYQELKDIRLHDFYLKKKYELLAFKVYSELNALGKSLTDFGSKLNWNDEKPIIFIDYGMTRGLGLMDLKYLISPNLVLGIQIQGEHYRMLIEDTTGKTATKIKNELDNNKLWFDFSTTFPKLKVYPKAEKGFNKYGNTFFYKSVKLGTELKINEIVKIILTDVERIESNLNKIKTIITTNRS